MKHYLKIAGMFLVLLTGGLGKIFAQGPGSTATYSGFVTITGTQTDISETLYIGPGTYTVDGTWEIYSKNVVIDPAAVITGSGTIQFYNPSAAGGVAGPTLIDGNNATNPVAVDIVLNNTDGMVISEIPFPADLIGAGFTNNTATSTLFIGKSFDLAVDGANVTLGSGVVGDFVFDDDATITNYSASRMVISNNSTLSHMVKQNQSDPFVFPVGIAAGDYTPATVDPSTAGTVHVSVQDYANAPPTILVKPEGMNRTWHIYCDAALPVSLTLVHNSPSTDGAAYTDNQAFITQNTTAAAWSSPGTIDFISAGVHTNTSYTLPASSTANTSYFTKASDVTSPLPVTLATFTAKPENNVILLKWSTSNEINSRAFEVERSADARNWNTIGTVFAEGESKTIRLYSYIDGKPFSGASYYRLKMLDQDGSFAYSTIRSVEMIGVIQLRAYPNPASDMLNIEASDWKNLKDVQIRNLDGKTLYKSGPVAVIDVRHLPAGIHILSLLHKDGSIEQKKIVIVR